MNRHPETPYLLLDKRTCQANIDRLKTHMEALGGTLRPHVKTAKCREVIDMIFPDGPGPITVSTLAEAEFFADAGYTDMIYAIGIVPAKLPRVRRLRERGVDLAVLLDNIDQARAVARFGKDDGHPVPALIEIDCDGHRGGIRPDDPALLAIADALADGGEVRGVLAHAGESYHCYTEAERVNAAENERVATVSAARTLRAHGHAAPMVSIGSTPTAHATCNLADVSDVRAGNFVFFDLVMAGIGTCTVDDIALSVVTSVIGHRPDKGWIMTDAGWTALSGDRGTAIQPVDQGYGIVATRDGTIIDDLIVTDLTQEHGVLAMRAGSTQPLPDIAVGTELRILPNHACATATQHDGYHVIEGSAGDITAYWPRIHGW